MLTAPSVWTSSTPPSSASGSKRYPRSVSASGAGQRRSLLSCLAVLLGAALLVLALLLLPQALGQGEQDSPRLLYAFVAVVYALPGCLLLWLGLRRRAQE